MGKPGAFFLNFYQIFELIVSWFNSACYIINLEKFKNHAYYEELKQSANTIERLKNSTSQRFIKTHLPYDLLPSKFRTGSTKTKIIYVTRNPKDSCISSFHHRKLLGGYRGDLEAYCDLFMKGLVTYGPYWNHVFSYWKQRNRENVLFIKFEDMKKNLPEVVTRVAEFLGKKLRIEEIRALCDHLSFENMKNNPAVNKDSLTEMVRNINNVQTKGVFIRNGAVGQWKNDLSQTAIDRFGQWEMDNSKNANITYSTL